MLTLDHQSPIPLHAQVEQLLRDLMRRPEYRNGELLPDEVTLAAQLGISRGTVSSGMPAETARMAQAGLRGDFVEARALHYRLLDLMRANFVESNPVPVKAAMALLGKCSDRVRAPLGPATEKTRQIMAAALAKAGLR